MQRASQTAVVIGDLSARAAASRVAEEREVLARRESGGWVGDRQLSELDEVIAAAARAELGPGAILHARRDAADAPVEIHDVVLVALLESCANAEPRLALERACQAILVGRQRVEREVEHRHLHPAGDIDADGVWNDGILRCENAADWQSVPDVGVGHQRRRCRHR